MITNHVTFFAAGTARERIALVNDQTAVYFSGLPGHIRPQDDLSRIDWRTHLGKVGGLQATIQPADGRDVRVTVEFHGGADYTRPQQALYITPGKSADFVELAPGAFTIGPLDHVIVPVDAAASEELERFVAGMAWLPRDDEQAVLNTLRNPGLEWRVRRLEELLPGTRGVWRWPAMGRRAVVAALAVVALAVITWGVIAWLYSGQAGSVKHAVTSQPHSAVPAPPSDQRKSLDARAPLDRRVLDVLIQAAGSKPLAIREIALERLRKHTAPSPLSDGVAILRVMLAAEGKIWFPRDGMSLTEIGVALDADAHRQALTSYSSLVRYLFCSAFPKAPVTDDVRQSLRLDSCENSGPAMDRVAGDADTLITKLMALPPPSPPAAKK